MKKVSKKSNKNRKLRFVLYTVISVMSYVKFYDLVIRDSFSSQDLRNKNKIKPENIIFLNTFFNIT